jgi:putative nucleotidyltransferase with HDIG domain
MIDLVGKIVTWLLVGHSTTSKIIRYILFFVMAILCVLEIAFYKEFNYFSLKDLFAMPTITILFEENKKIIGIIGAINTLFFLIVYLLQDKKMKERKNCGLRQIALEDIARIWVEQEHYKQVIREELKQEMPPPQKETKIVIPTFQTEGVKSFFNDTIIPFQKNISDLGLEIIIQGLKILEEHKDTPSVVSYYEGDNEYKELKNQITTSLSSFDILKNINLLQHTLNVAKESIKMLEKKYKKEYQLYLERVVIAAIYHDIGKIKKMEEKLNGITIQLFKSTPHYDISKLIFAEKYPEYKLKDEIIEAIENHHNSYKKSNNKILEILIKADKEARKKEIDKFLQDKKIKENNEQEVNQSENEDEENKKQDKVKEEIKNKNEVEEIEKEPEETQKDNDEDKTDENIKEEIKEDNNDLGFQVDDIDNFDNNSNKAKPQPKVEKIEIEFEYEFDKVWEEFATKIKENPCAITFNKVGVDYNKKMIIPFEEKLFVSSKTIRIILKDIVGDISEEQVKAFLLEAKERKFAGLFNPNKGFWATKIDVFLKEKIQPLNMYGNIFYEQHIFKNEDFTKIVRDCEVAKKIKILIPNFKD